MLPPIFVISLARAADRRKAITARLTAAGVNFEIVEAVDGENLNLRPLHDRLDYDAQLRIKGKKLSEGEIGCFLSHYNLWARLVEEKIPYALVLEDDTIWQDDFWSVVHQIMQAELEWDVINCANDKHPPYNEAERVVIADLRAAAKVGRSRNDGSSPPPPPTKIKTQFCDNWSSRKKHSARWGIW